MQAIIKMLVSGVIFASALANCTDFFNTVQYFSVLSWFDYHLMRIGLMVLIFVEIFIALNILSVSNPIVFYRLVMAILFSFILLTMMFMVNGVSFCVCMGRSIPVHSLSRL